MKKLISTVIVLALILSLSVTVFAVDTVKVYCDAPDDWETCHVHWWGSAQGESQWPGDAMTKGSDGIWYAEIPADVGGLLFNKLADDGKTADLTLPTDGKLMFSIEANAWGAYGSEIEVVEKYFVAGSAGLCGSEWNPGDPANEMTETSDGVWTKTYTNVAAGTYEFKITVGSWSKDWGVEGTDADGNPVVSNYVLELAEAADVTITFTPADGAISVNTGSAPVDPSEPADPSDPSVAPSDPSVAPSEPSVAPSEPSVAPSEPAAKGVTVTVTAPSDWTKVRIWAWRSADNSNPLGGGWPGTELTKSGDKWTITIPATDVDRYVINGDVNGEVKQTGDLNIVAGKNVVIVIGTAGADGKFAAEVSYNGSVAVGPVDPALKGEHRVTGSAEWMGKVWDPANPNGLMTEISDGVYEITYKNVPVGNYEFKITRNGVWDNAWGQGGKGGQANIPMVVSVAGDVTVRLNVGTGALSYKTAASGEWVPVTGDMGIAAVCAALLLASAGLVCAVSKKKEF